MGDGHITGFLGSITGLFWGIAGLLGSITGLFLGHVRVQLLRPGLVRRHVIRVIGVIVVLVLVVVRDHVERVAERCANVVALKHNGVERSLLQVFIGGTWQQSGQG